MTTARSFRTRTFLGVFVAAAAMLVTVFGLRSVTDPNPTTAQAKTIVGSMPAMAVYEMQVGARGLPVQEFQDPI